MSDRQDNRSVGFTDAAYISQDEAPKTPRSYDSSSVRRPGWTVAGLCVLLFAAGALLNAALYEPQTDTYTSPTPMPPAADGITVGAEISAAANADTPPQESAETGGRPYLGIVVQTVSCAAAEYYNRSDANVMVPGVQVYAVDDDSPACDAGLCSGDIIIRLDDQDIKTSADLTDAESARVPGGSAVLTVFRNGEYSEVPVVFSALPEAEECADDWCDFNNAW